MCHRPDRTALVLGGTTVPTPDQAYLDAVRDHFVGPTHPDQTIEYVAVTAPDDDLARHGDRSPHLARDRTAEHLGS